MNAENNQYESHIITLADKEEARAVKWLQSATSKDAARPILTTIYVKNGRTVTADGFRIHSINTPETLKEFEGKNLHPDSKIAVNPRPEPFCEYPGNFPDCDQIKQLAEKSKPIVKIGLNKKFLADLADMPTGSNNMIILTITDPNKPVVITTREEDYQAEVILMPMRIDL